MEARVARPRFTLAMISSAGFFQMNGVGFSLHPSAQMPISSCRWATEVNAPFFSRRLVSWANQLSTRLSHDELVGVKCKCRREISG